MQTPEVLHDSKTFLALLKPAGWVVNDAKTAHGNQTLQDFIKKEFDFPLAKNADARNGIVHRLDKETSGLILVAKTKEALEQLQSQFAKRETQKTYVALVHGRLTAGGTIEMPIARDKEKRTHFTIDPQGRDARTEVKATDWYTRENEQFSLLSITPKTGRTHQIRVHLSYIKHPIVSDPLYAGRQQGVRDRVWCERMFLHAQALTFTNPDTNTLITIEVPLPTDLSQVLLHELKKAN